MKGLCDMTPQRAPRLLCIGLLLATVASPAGAQAARIYVTDSGGERVEAIDPTTNKVVQVIGGIGMPHGVGFSLDGRQIYVSDESKGALDIIDRASGTIIVTDASGAPGPG
jgi:YVTN family beta-propeller protein